MFFLAKELHNRRIAGDYLCQDWYETCQNPIEGLNLLLPIPGIVWSPRRTCLMRIQNRQTQWQPCPLGDQVATNCGESFLSPERVQGKRWSNEAVQASQPRWDFKGVTQCKQMYQHAKETLTKHDKPAITQHPSGVNSVQIHLRLLRPRDLKAVLCSRVGFPYYPH